MLPDTVWRHQCGSQCWICKEGNVLWVWAGGTRSLDSFRQDQLHLFQADLTGLVAEGIGRAVFWRHSCSHDFCTFPAPAFEMIKPGTVMLDLGLCVPFSSSPAICHGLFLCTAASIQSTWFTYGLCLFEDLVWSFLPWPHKWTFSKSLLQIRITDTWQV